MYSATFYKTYFQDSEEYGIYIPSEEERQNENFDPLYWVCYNAAKTICFDDCSDEIVVEIVCEGRKLKYAGWQPNMVYEFYDAETNESVWRASFPSWDH